MQKINNVSKKKKLILYELNEVPIKLINKYIEIKPNSSFQYLLEKGHFTETITHDKGELHPWTTWPTLHRGVNNNYHKIQFINQPLNTSSKFPPVWDILQQNGFKIGVFGSLQSYPPIKSKNVSFYLPDTFSPDDKAYPKILKDFQNFNLKVCSENKSFSNHIDKSLYLDFLKLILSGGFSPSSLSKIIYQILKEKINNEYYIRRSLFQPVLGFDLFYKCLNKYQPNFCTFFTNHIAGIIHRYWRDLFPEDFSDNEYEVSNFKKDSVIIAMEIADKQIYKLIKYCKKNNSDLWIASSMSQKARKDNPLPWDIHFMNFSVFLEFFNLNKKYYSLLPAMQPDYSIKCNTQNDLLKIKGVISKVRDNQGNQIINETYREENAINISLKLTKSLFNEKFIIIDQYKHKLEDIGIRLIKRDPGTAYHTPEGILIKYGDNSQNKIFGSNIIDTTEIEPSILSYFGIQTDIN